MQASLCPAGQGVPGRDSCIVACSPPGACLANGICSVGYVNAPPLYRCGSCDAQFYQTNGECVRCPASTWALIVVVVLVVIAGSAIGYLLSQKNINLAFLSIGVDFFQVRAAAAAAAPALCAPSDVGCCCSYAD